MSHVSSMIVTCAIGEEDADGALAALHEWCAGREPRPIRFGVLDDGPAVCNSKGMQTLVLACAANYFDEDALIEAFPTFKWQWPQEALLVIHPEHECPPRIVRGDGWIPSYAFKPRDADHASNWLYERAEEASYAGLPLDKALQVVQDGYSSAEFDREYAAGKHD